MTRILHLVASDHRRGAETFAVELAAHHRACGHEVRVMAVATSGVVDPLPVEAAARSRIDPRGAARIVAAARWSEVVVSFGSSSLSIGAIAAQLARRPFVYRQIGDPSVWGRVRASNLRIGAPARSARAVVALYPGAASTLADLYDIDPAAIRVIPRGVPADRYRPAAPEERSAALGRLGLDPERAWVAYVGALSDEKDPLLACAALRHLDDRFGLVVAGDGPLAGAVADQSGDLGDRVRLLGAVDDVRRIYAAADVLVLPSRTEGIPGVAVEAGLCGLPVVSFAVGGVPSVVLDGQTGILVADRSAEAVATAVVAAEEQREVFGAAARSHCLENFSMASIGRAWGFLIEEVAS